METIKASSKGQIVIPKAIREALEIREGTALTVEMLPDRSVRLKVREAAAHASQVKALAGSLAHLARAAGSARRDDAGLLRAVARDDARTRARRRRR